MKKKVLNKKEKKSIASLVPAIWGWKGEFLRLEVGRKETASLGLSITVTNKTEEGEVNRSRAGMGTREEEGDRQL